MERNTGEQEENWQVTAEGLTLHQGNFVGPVDDGPFTLVQKERTLLCDSGGSPPTLSPDPYGHASVGTIMTTPIRSWNGR
jgi:hypothetical protein